MSRKQIKIISLLIIKSVVVIILIFAQWLTLTNEYNNVYIPKFSETKSDFTTYNSMQPFSLEYWPMDYAVTPFRNYTYGNDFYGKEGFWKEGYWTYVKLGFFNFSYSHQLWHISSNIPPDDGYFFSFVSYSKNPPFFPCYANINKRICPHKSTIELQITDSSLFWQKRSLVTGFFYRIVSSIVLITKTYKGLKKAVFVLLLSMFCGFGLFLYVVNYGLLENCFVVIEPLFLVFNQAPQSLK
jgi:hypothetical protein